MSKFIPIKNIELIDPYAKNFMYLKYCEIRVLAKNKSSS